MKELEKACKKFEAKELFKIINKMKWKAPGQGGGKERFLELCNEIYFQGKVPDTWKQAITVPRIKKGKPAKDPSSYRPRIKRGLIPVQTGLRKGMSIYTKAIRSKHPKIAILTLFDAKKAFDSVWHTGVPHKAMKDGLPAIFIRFLRSWLYKRTMKIRLGTTLSRTILLDSGVPQGSVLAPNIWNYNTGDIPTTITT